MENFYPSCLIDFNSSKNEKGPIMDEGFNVEIMGNNEFDSEGLHTIAQCMWWVMKGDDLPENELQRNELWEIEQPEWLRLARQVWMHSVHNGIGFVRLPKVNDE